MFWETLVGRRDDPRSLRPYGLRIPATFDGNIAKAVLDAYEEIVRAHYSMFCELAGAHFLLTEAQASYGQVDRGEALFRFVEAFNGFYDHLGTRRNMSYRLWKKLGGIVEAIGTSGALSGRAREGGQALVELCLTTNGMTSTIQDLGAVESEVVPIRDNHVHASGTTFVLLDGRYWFRLSTEEVQRRFAGLNLKPEEEEACARMRRHLDLVERYLNESEELLARELGSAPASGNIDVDS
ncbi:MAG: hypothetical protein WA691_02495 [Thermoplasmata archaeon]